MNFQGRVVVKNDSIGIDAEPHIMSVARRLFPHAKPIFQSGKYTHKIIVLQNNLSNAKDAMWFSGRYNFEFLRDSEEILKRKSEEYDEIVRSVSESGNDNTLRVTRDALQPSLEFRDHQIKFMNMANTVKRILLADSMGLGKTISAISACLESDSRPAIVLCPPPIFVSNGREKF